MGHGSDVGADDTFRLIATTRFFPGLAPTTPQEVGAVTLRLQRYIACATLEGEQRTERERQ